MEQLPTTIDSLIELPSPSDPQISPDGKWIAYVVSKPDWKENAYVNQIYLVATDGETTSRQLTFTKKGSWMPRWSPDSEILIFLSERADDKATQIYRLSVTGGEAERLTELDNGIQSIAFSPDGKKIAFVAVPSDSPQQKKREEKFGEYVEDNVDYSYAHMWMLTLDNKKITQLTSGEGFHVRDYEWHPDSKRIAVNAMPSPDMGFLLKTRNYLLDIETFSCEPITPLRTFNPVWSPDGTKLLYERGVADSLDGAFYKNSWLETVTLEDGSISKIEMTFDEEAYPQTWVDDGIYFWAFQKTSIRLMHTTTDGSAIRSVIPTDMSDFVSLQYSFSEDARHCATIFATAERVNEVAVMDTKTGDIRILTDFDEATREWNLPIHELYSWQSEDGTVIEGILTKPKDFDPDKKYPLFVITHGGPTWISLRSKLGGYERRLYPIYQWVHQGAIVLQPNYRGGAGYGEKFRSLNVRDLGTGDYADVISGVDALIAEGYIDEARIAKMGWSQGGYISAFTTTYSDRFAAVSVGAGISNWMTYYVNTDIHPFTINYLQATPWDDPDIYAKTSPMTYIKNAKTPTLIQHGEKDKRVPLPNAYELHQGLIDQNVESKLVVYPGMGHGPSKPKQVRHIMMDNYHWFNRHIFGIESDDAAKDLYVVMASTKEDADLTSAVYHLAERDGAHYRVVTSSGMLSDKRNDASSSPDIDDLSEIIDSYTAYLTENEIQNITLFSDKVDDNRAVLRILGCFQIAASNIEKMTVTHKTDLVLLET